MRLRTWILVSLCLVGAACDDFRGKPRAPAELAPAASTPAPQAPSGYVAPYGSGGGAVPAAVPSNTQVATIDAPPMPAPAAGSTTREGKAIDTADLTAGAAGQDQRDVLIRAQVILDRAHFSPGVIDGRGGSNFRRALGALEKANGLPTSPLSGAIWKAMLSADNAPVTQDYVITAEDVKGPFLGSVPSDMAALARLPRLDYASPVQELAEKFHMDQALLRALNPGADFGAAGSAIVVARPGGDPLPPVQRIEVDKSQDVVRAFGQGGKLVAQFPATVGSTERPAPSGTWAVRAVATNPTYTYDPRRLTFGDTSNGVLKLAPGPNSLVGTTWIALTASTYGIHGTPDPTKIGKTASHGCVRLTNWDAAALGHAVRKGTPVVFVGGAG
ncbi:MAG TPA: L,D-transpeptidase [Caulobacteraceae bacterium]|jgi:lipoprotein-anchoring transpeptidase ErfK/SrfK